MRRTTRSCSWRRCWRSWAEESKSPSSQRSLRNLSPCATKNKSSVLLQTRQLSCAWHWPELTSLIWSKDHLLWSGRFPSTPLAMTFISPSKVSRPEFSDDYTADATLQMLHGRCYTADATLQMLHGRCNNLTKTNHGTTTSYFTTKTFATKRHLLQQTTVRNCKRRQTDLCNYIISIIWSRLLKMKLWIDEETYHHKKVI